MTAAASDTSPATRAGRRNEDLVVAIAVDVLTANGWLEEEPDERLLIALHRLYHAHPSCQTAVFFTGELLHDLLAGRSGGYLAAAYAADCQEAWGRAVPTWICDCGTTYKVLPGGRLGRADDQFFEITADGLIVGLVGTLRGSESRTTAAARTALVSSTGRRSG